MYRIFLKRLIDLILSILGFTLTLPVFIPTLLFLLYQNKGYPFFFQARPGLLGKTFQVVKFKTMTNTKDGSGNLLSDNQRTTPIGRFLRNYSLDELPQLINVIKGDMSLVGPRPLLVAYLPLYNKVQARRHEVRPGITGWAQVNGRNAISWEQKFEYDVWYVDHMSFGLDLKIFWKTLIKVFKREGINAGSATTMEAFKGSFFQKDNL